MRFRQWASGRGSGNTERAALIPALAVMWLIGIQPVEAEAITGDLLHCHGSWKQVDTRDDLGNLSEWPINHLIVLSDTEVAVAFQAIDEGCSGANVEVTETDKETIIKLLTGLPPEAASSTCLNEDVNKYITVGLTSPINTRQVIAATLKSTTATAAFENYLGLTLDAAAALAIDEGRTARPIWIDGEDQTITDDLDFDRVNFAVLNNVVIGVASDYGDSLGVTTSIDHCQSGSEQTPRKLPASLQ